MSEAGTNGRCRIVLTGGPGGGKTTAVDLFRREIGERVVVVPEAATMLFRGGFPRSNEIHAREGRSNRPFFTCSATSKTCNPRSTQSGYCFATEGPSTAQPIGPAAPPNFRSRRHYPGQGARALRCRSLLRDCRGGRHVDRGGEPGAGRIERASNGADHRLRDLWLKHPRAVVVPHHPSFVKKIMLGLVALENMVNDLTSPQP